MGNSISRLAHAMHLSSTMRKLRFHGVALAALVGLLAPLSSACAVEEDPPAAYGEYEPQYYDGYVVYYDGVGRPYYYANGAVFWVPPSSPFYVGFVNSWRIHGPGYARWYSHHGYRYRGYRRAYRR